MRKHANFGHPSNPTRKRGRPFALVAHALDPERCYVVSWYLSAGNAHKGLRDITHPQYEDLQPPSLCVWDSSSVWPMGVLPTD